MADLQQTELLTLVAQDARDALSRLCQRIDHSDGATDVALLREIRATAGLHAARLRLALKVPVSAAAQNIPCNVGAPDQLMC